MTANPCAEIDPAVLDDPMNVVVRALLALVPGVEATAYRPVAQTAPDMNGVPHYQIHFTGWSPSLHRVSIVAIGRCSQTTLHPETMAAEATEILKPILDIQQERADRARALGILEPLPLPSGGDHDIPDHVHLDRSLAAVLETSFLSGLTADVGTEIGNALRTLHSGFRMYRGGRLDQSGDIYSGELPTRKPRDPYDSGDPISMLGFRAMLRQPSGGVIAPTFDGVQIRIQASLPDTALASLAGKTVGSVANLHPALDGREIAIPGRIEQDDLGTFLVLTLRPDPVSWGELRKVASA